MSHERLSTAKVEVDYLRVTGEVGTLPFLQAPQQPVPELPKGINGVVRHILK